MNNFSITFENGRITKLLKFLSSITKDKSKYNSNEGNMVIIKKENNIVFKIVSNGMCSLYQYFIREGEEMQITGSEKDKRLIVNVHDFISKIVDKGIDSVVKIHEYNGSLKFE